tara:strand:- start:8549 stop:9319 length:771 start_codon:yes stop_codon:yes gene_type:complete
MILCLDVGNSHIYGGVFDKDKIHLRFRHNTQTASSSDELGLFLRNVLRENSVDPDAIENIAICSVVPQILYSLNNCCKKYFGRQAFILQAGVKTGLKINYRNPIEVGADRIANSIAATHLYPEENLIVVDFGTATTLCVLNKKKEYLGGLILPGIRLNMESLEAKTAKLPSVEIVKTDIAYGRSTVESIQAGLYYNQLFSVKGMIARIHDEVFKDQSLKVIGTGGFARMYESEGIFDSIEPDLVLKGLYLALQQNI